VTVLGAVTHAGDSLYFWTEENLTAVHGIRLLQALVAEFGEQLVVLLDQAPYFYAKDLWKFVSGKRSTECVDSTSENFLRKPSLEYVDEASLRLISVVHLRLAIVQYQVCSTNDTSVECVCGSSLQAWYYPPHLPELNPLESCWNQFKDWFKYRLIKDLPSLKETLTTAFPTITEPDIIDYISSD
jgi:hypothetical protein